MPNQGYSPPLWMGNCNGNAELSEAECLDLRSMYSEPERFRSRIEMARYRFGNGEYQYFKYPLPDTVAELHEELYRHLAPVATDWMEALELRTRFTGELTSFLEGVPQPHSEGANAFAVLISNGDFNCLYQDVYGEVVFPFQVIIGHIDPHTEYMGEELLLIEQKPCAQCDTAGHGEAVIITTRFRPVKSSLPATVRHGVSTITAGSALRSEVSSTMQSRSATSRKG